MKIPQIIPVCVFIIVSNICFSNAAVNNISADTLNKWITTGTAFDFMLIDVRDTSELTSVIATDACRPYHLSWTQGVFATSLSRLPKTANLVLYCGLGIRSGIAGQLLVDSGYVSVYALIGGMNDWTGPTKTSAAVKPFSDLPAPSMLKTSARVFWEGAGSERAFGLKRTSDGLYVGAPLPAGHELELISMQGRCVVRASDPFVSNTRFVPPDFLKGVFIARTIFRGRAVFKNLKACFK